jgi:hypothetical protein
MCIRLNRLYGDSIMCRNVYQFATLVMSNAISMYKDFSLATTSISSSGLVQAGM